MKEMSSDIAKLWSRELWRKYYHGKWNHNRHNTSMFFLGIYWSENFIESGVKTTSFYSWIRRGNRNYSTQRMMEELWNYGTRREAGLSTIMKRYIRRIVKKYVNGRETLKELFEAHMRCQVALGSVATERFVIDEKQILECVMCIVCVCVCVTLLTQL